MLTCSSTEGLATPRFEKAQDVVAKGSVKGEPRRWGFWDAVVKFGQE